MKALLRLLILLAGLGALQAPALAHEVRPAYLEIREIAAGEYDILWKTPAQGVMRLALDVVLPEGCTTVGEPRTILLDASVLARWRETCPEGLVGQEIGVDRLKATLTDALVRFEPLDGAAVTLRLTPDAPSATIPAKQGWSDVAGTYFGLGVEHILLGFDHLIFVLALLLLVRGVGRLAGAITAFTLAHSLTLAGATLGVFSLPPSPVEATIALSIIFVAVEIMRVRAGADSLTARMPWLVSFSFGLLHGFGFAGALREIGLPQDAVGSALLFFNLGVEGGQLLFVAAVLLARFAWRSTKLPEPGWMAVAPVYLIGGTAAFWFIERMAGIIQPG